MLIFAAALASGDTPLSVPDLLAAVARYERPRDDKFSPRPTDEQIIGRPFRAAARFAELTDEGGPRMGRNGGWLYNPDTATLTLKPWVDLIIGDELTSDPTLHGVEKAFHGFVVAAHGRYLGKATEGNAFGATINVDQYTGTSLSIGKYEQSFSPKVFPDGLEDGDLVKSVPMPPAVARAVTPNLNLVIEGTIEAYSPKHAIACGEGLAPATFERHSERLMHECVVSADIRRFAVEDGKDGHVYAEWLATPTSANLSGADNLEQTQSNSGRLFGVVFAQSPNGALLISVAPGTRAAQAGLKQFQIITAVNGKSVIGLSAADVSALLKALPKRGKLALYGGGDVSIP